MRKITNPSTDLFHQRDIADLTSTIMGDCANFEHAFPIPFRNFWSGYLNRYCLCGPADFQLANGPGPSLGSSDFLCDCTSVTEMAGKAKQKHMNARLELAEGIQECLETVQDIKACNQEEDYLRKLDAKMDAAEKHRFLLK